MQDVTDALHTVRDMYEKVLGKPAPEIDPDAYVPFPPGVDPFRHTAEEVRHLERLTEQMAAAGPAVTWVPRADSYATPDGYVIHIEIPGVEKDDLKVLTVGDEVVVRGTRRPPAGMEKLAPLSVERPWGPFERRFAFRTNGLSDRITARTSQGVLELRIKGPGAEASREKAVPVA